jgi:gamma-D-glutamyl-L-lysine dipeptidyl-peptidase
MFLQKWSGLGLLLWALLSSCAAPSPPHSDNIPSPSAAAETDIQSTLKQIGYTIQVGAFANPDNATRLAALLESRQIDAYSFLHESGLYKVRFGDHDSYAAARQEAEILQSLGIIDSFFIVIPESAKTPTTAGSKPSDLRQSLVSTARGFIGVPYNWGGTTAANGFDCSGLTMVTYRLNGLKLPRVSRDQYNAGRPISRSALRKGDLVFFATNGGRRVSHVGLYIGNDRFIHAPRRGKSVRVSSLGSGYFQKTFVGARSYL